MSLTTEEIQHIRDIDQYIRKLLNFISNALLTRHSNGDYNILREGLVSAHCGYFKGTKVVGGGIILPGEIEHHGILTKYFFHLQSSNKRHLLKLMSFENGYYDKPYTAFLRDFYKLKPQKIIEYYEYLILTFLS